MNLGIILIFGLIKLNFKSGILTELKIVQTMIIYES